MNAISRKDIDRLPQARTLQELVERLASHGPEPALVIVKSSTIETWSFKRLHEHAKQIAEELHSNGVGRGEPVGLLGPNSAAWISACLGILASGAAAMPLDIQQSEPERSAWISGTGCRMLYVSNETPGEGKRLALQRHENAPLPDRQSLAGRAPSPPGPKPEDPALLMHTSGTTGAPRAVPLSHSNILSNIHALAAENLVGPGDIALLPLPLHHIYPLVVGLLLPLSAGASVVLPSGISGPELARALTISGANILVGVPRLYDALVGAILEQVRARGPVAAALFNRVLRLSTNLACRGWPTFGYFAFGGVRRRLAPALRRLTSGGAALDEEAEKTLIGLGFEVLVGYGLTETSPIVTFNRTKRTRVGSTGEALSGADVRIARAAAGGVGEIEVRGPNVFAGYLNDLAATRAAFTADGWLRTGDLGRVDADGYLFVKGRASETLVLPSGEKLDPETVEEEYAISPMVGEIGVLLDNAKLVGVVVPSASAVPVGTEQARESAVRDGLAQRAKHLPRYMQLSGFAVVEGPLPRTPLGKLRRHLLPLLYRAARERQETRSPESTESPLADPVLREAAARQLWKRLEERFPHRRLSLEMSPQLDLGVDSLEWIALTMDLEGTLGITLDEAALERVGTLRDLVETAMEAKRAATVASIAETIAEIRWLAPPGPAARAIWCTGHVINQLLLRLLFQLRVEGLEHLPERDPFVLCPNHASFLDGPALAAALPWSALRRLFWAGSTHVMFSTPSRRIFSRLARVLPIDPFHSARTGLTLGAEVLHHDGILVWFPEGFLTTDGTLLPFLPGIGSLVLHAPVPIVPVRITGTLGAWLPQHRLPRPRHVTVRFGPPLDTRRLAVGGVHENREETIAAEVKAAVSAL